MVNVLDIALEKLTPRLVDGCTVSLARQEQVRDVRHDGKIVFNIHGGGLSVNGGDAPMLRAQ